MSRRMKLSSAKSEIKKLQWFIPLILVTLTVASVLPPFLNLYQRSSFIEDYEYEAAQWIKENTSKETLLVSDQASMLFLSGLCDKVALIQLTQGYPKDYPTDMQRLALIYQLFLTDDAYEVYNLLSELKTIGITTEEYFTALHPIEKQNYLIVISPRTSTWVDRGGKTVIWYPNGNVYSNTPTSMSIKQDYLTKFFDSDLFSLVYEDEGKIYIFKPVWNEIFQAADYPSDVGKNVDDAVLALDFNEQTSTTLLDTSGNNNDGTIVGATWSTEESHKALKFDGINDYVLVHSSDSLNITDELTIETWIQAGTMTERGWHEIVSKGSKYVYHLFYNDEIQKLSMGIKIGGAAYFLELPYVPDGAWHNLVGTYKSGEFKIYFDGILNKSRTDVHGAIDTNDEPLILGSLQTGDNLSTCYWNGSIGKVRIYNRILKPTEITAHFEGNTDVYTIRQATVRENSAGYMVEKPLENLTKVDTELKMKVMINDDSSDMTAFSWEIYDETSGTIVYHKDVKANEFSEAKTYKYIATTFVFHEINHVLHLRILFADHVDVSIKKIFIN